MGVFQSKFDVMPDGIQAELDLVDEAIARVRREMGSQPHLERAYKEELSELYELGD